MKPFAEPLHEPQREPLAEGVRNCPSPFSLLPSPYPTQVLRPTQDWSLVDSSNSESEIVSYLPATIHDASGSGIEA